ncbi:hypothetical protein [Cystobacter ferrugineus]|uniref:Uncharacterized protein n=1 Tax=Cystobacter ferrugineus TaxID=83449 RepID=A0A1L9BBP7_9BACT|nr:hypothetical protein [Cystobacter ferrugineus]OJH39623.1 hypothetical protein BON30_19245 [Cystobacter ferrugineus]
MRWIDQWLGRVCALLVAAMVFMGAAPSGEAAREAELTSLLRRLAAREKDASDSESWSRLELPGPNDVILGKGARTLGAAAARLQKAYALTPEAARHFLAARLWLVPPGKPWESLSEEQALRALEAHRAALREAPGHPALAASLSEGMGELINVPGYVRAVAEALDTAPDPAELALRLARLEHHVWSSEFVAYAVSREPETLPRALDILGLDSPGGSAAQFYLAAWHALTASKEAPFPRELAESLVRNLLAQCMPGLALKVLDAFPADARQALLAKDGGGLSGEQRLARDELGLSIAVTLLASGREAEARVWHEAVKARTAVAPEKSDDEWLAERAKLHRELADFLFAWKPGADSFELLLLRVDDAFGTAGALLSARALAARFPERARDEFRWAVRTDDRSPSKDRLLLPADRLSFLTAARAELEAAFLDERARIEKVRAQLTPPSEPRGTVAPDPMAARISAHLATPVLQVFIEKELPKGRASGSAETAWTPMRTLELPRGFQLVRAERSNQRVIAVALSQRLDPVGMLSGGGYWVLLSEDGGQLWEAPLYTGLRQFHPYVLETASPVSLLDGQVLRLAASVRELDEKSITFPPINLKMKREVEGRMLEAPLAALRQDTDGDGLTDLVEDRLLLDAKAADTDGDGTPDGNDTLPLMPSAPSEPPADARAELVSTLLFELAGKEEQAETLRLPQFQAPTSLEDLSFLSLDRAGLRGVRAPATTVTFSGEELEGAQKRFGGFTSLSLDVYVNLAGDQALLVWNQHWRGGSFLARREKGRWVLEERESWVT